MKRIFLLLFVIVSLKLDAQYIVNYAQNVDQNELDGFYYSLPRNVIRLDFEVERISETKGEYADYAEELLGVDVYIKDNNTKYNIKGVKVNVMTEADDEMAFYISFDDKVKENHAFNIDLTSEGYIRSFGVRREGLEASADNLVFDGIVEQYDVSKGFQYIPLREDDESDELEEDGDDVVLQKTRLSEKEVAQTVVDEIKRIRLAYFDLISGYQEVNYGNTINTMLDELKKMEEEYLGLFVGKTVKHSFVKSFFVIPEKGTDNYLVAKFSESEGFNAKSGVNVKIVLQNIASSNVKKLSEETVKNTTYNNKMVYREPACVNMKLMIGENMILDDRIQINQFGNYIIVPMNKMRLQFDGNGSLVSVVKE